MDLKPGWLARQLNEVAIESATWPKWMSDGKTELRLTPAQRKEAARRLRARADELDPPEEKHTCDSPKSTCSKPSKP